ncbi:head-tail adaptor protein [Duganella sp. CY15W]|uniref:head-tail adaptor protein n=1 Tax=Duganella sp. CY15W TaxID=2692172 RepID=UPI001369015B|nr:head-tail adaptor protein [Duganella sp. CY15W]MYM31488.1 head-tail adaptor protein [Duganella sp. CY15W]
MRGSQLDRRITIERPTQVELPGYGMQPGPWEPVASRIPAQVFDDLPSKSETVRDGLALAKKTARVRIRYIPGLSSDLRVVVHGEADQQFQIVGGPAELGRRRWIEMTVESFSS